MREGADYLRAFAASFILVKALSAYVILSVAKTIIVGV